MALQQRLLRDIAELQSKPYPFISWIPYENDIQRACLILTPDNHVPLHLSVAIPYDFPLQPPEIRCNTIITHPNIFGEYICATILNTTEGYTPAYTLKGIAIQILSFFTSENLDQDHGFGPVNLKSYSEQHGTLSRQYTCWTCRCNTGLAGDPIFHITSKIALSPPVDIATCLPNGTQNTTSPTDSSISNLPDEILAMLCGFLEDEDLVNFSRAWSKIGGPSGLVSRFNLVRNRELQCFVLKKSFQDTMLGVGVRVETQGRTGTIASEFDLISWEAFSQHRVRTSVQGIGFHFWMPLPISRHHYDRARDITTRCLNDIGYGARISPSTSSAVIYHFMTDVVVKLSDATTPTRGSRDHKTTLKHASEKAIESYFHLFHILLCLATSDRSIVLDANSMLQNFLNGQTSKAHCPNLGHLLLAVLIADVDLTQNLLMAIIRETATRNVVWMLDKKGADMPELAYMEPDAVCEYRMSKTFEASKTSYRLLMFFNLFRRTIARGVGPNRRSLVAMRDQLFDAHGAPPFGAAARLAVQVKNVQEVNDFYSFLEVMDIQNMPTKQQLTKFLRDCVEASMRVGYSVWGMSQPDAKNMREGVARGILRIHTFFPGKSAGSHASQGGNSDGRGRGHGHGRRDARECRGGLRGGRGGRGGRRG
jgi:ubiquitin-protein ligase